MSKLAVIYYSATGHGTAMAKRVAAAAEAPGQRCACAMLPKPAIRSPSRTTRHGRPTTRQPRICRRRLATISSGRIPSSSDHRLDSEDRRRSSGHSSTRCLWVQGKLADKVYAGFTSSQSAHGGQETSLINLYTTLMHFGGIVVPPGYTDPAKFVDGNPYGVGHITGPENKNPLDEATLSALDHLAGRVISVADRLNSNPEMDKDKLAAVSGSSAKTGTQND
jgi:NAD(P)H dehydrogenase (quinone)